MILKMPEYLDMNNQKQYTAFMKVYLDMQPQSYIPFPLYRNI